MITTLDRMVLVSYVRSYAIVWTSLIGLFVVIDLFTHLDAFMSRPGSFPAIAAYIVRYYLFHVPQVFDLMAEPIALLAATFTVSWMQRNNELLPQLSAGIPTRRIVRPVLFGAAVAVALAPLNTELVIPEIADELMASRDDPEGAKAQLLMGAYDTSGVHIEGLAGYRKDRRVDRFCATFPESSPSGMVHVTAEEAVYIPPGDDPLTGGWMLTGVGEPVPSPLPTNFTVLGTGRGFLRTDTADYDTVRRGGTWYIYASTVRLRELLGADDSRRQTKMAVLFHTRITRPVIGMLLVLLGVSVILWNPNRHIALSAGLCMALGTGYYACVIGCTAIGNSALVSPAMAAWIPVMIYGPLAFVAFDMVHT
ncbi:LptF/LptG family permease [Gemmata sp.]|uniref:LptF/LptG family permease n=1 Tax=Gemmata sp. TaxID=1914242 RepID=UPI003F723F09